MDSDNNKAAYARFELNFFNKKFNTKVAFKAVPKKKINMLFAVLGRSVLGKFFFPIRTSRTANNIYVRCEILLGKF